MSGARCAERASEVGARGRIDKTAGVLITAIPFGSAARRCSWENGIFCYQMTVLIETLFHETSLFEECRGYFSAAFEKLNEVNRVTLLNLTEKQSPGWTRNYVSHNKMSEEMIF